MANRRLQNLTAQVHEDLDIAVTAFAFRFFLEPAAWAAWRMCEFVNASINMAGLVALAVNEEVEKEI